MTDTSHDHGMGADESTTHSGRHTRRLAIVGVLALVLVAGAVLVGVKSTGARSGATTSTNVTVTCAFVERPVVGEPTPMYFPGDAVNMTVTPNSALNDVVLTLNIKGGDPAAGEYDPDYVSTTSINLGAANSVAITKGSNLRENFDYWVSWTVSGVAYETAHGTACS